MTQVQRDATRKERYDLFESNSKIVVTDEVRHIIDFITKTHSTSYRTTTELLDKVRPMLRNVKHQNDEFRALQELDTLEQTLFDGNLNASTQVIHFMQNAGIVPMGSVQLPEDGRQDAAAAAAGNGTSTTADADRATSNENGDTQ